MKLDMHVVIDAPKDDVWKVISNIENAHNVISGIEDLEVLEKPPNGLVGLKWRESRTLFGKTASETMWITEAQENEFYKTRAESHGAVYTATVAVSDQDGKTRLSMNFNGAPQTVGTKIMAALTAPFFNSVTRKALQQDLVDIKAAIENPSTG